MSSYDALLLDLDGTLVDDHDRVQRRTVSALRAAEARGVHVMVATGRSESATHPVLEELGLDGPAIVYNGACLYCPRTRSFLEERVLSPRTLERALEFGRARDLLTVTMGEGLKRVRSPRREVERLALRDMTELQIVSGDELGEGRVIRVSLFSDGHASSRELAAEVEAAVDQPILLTHFPLSLLASHRESKLLVVDVHPPCRGKAEGLRVLEETHGIPPERVVAVGDATNDLEMIQGAGLGVAMGNSMPELLEAADRVIGDNNSAALAELVEELFDVQSSHVA